MRMENVAPLSPPCPTCGKEMRLTGHAPTCDGVIYEFLCGDDGDLLSWTMETSSVGGLDVLLPIATKID